MKNLRMAYKLAIGFGGVILLTAVIGSLAARDMSQAVDESNLIAFKELPELRELYSLDQNFRQAMLNVRTFALSESVDAYNAAGASFNAVKHSVEQLGKLSKEYPELKALAVFLPKVGNLLENYQTFTQQSHDRLMVLVKLRKVLDEQGDAFVKELSDISMLLQQLIEQEDIPSQNMTSLQRRLRNIRTLEDSVNEIGVIRRLAQQAQAQNDSDLLKKAEERLQRVKTTLVELSSALLTAHTKVPMEKALVNIEAYQKTVVSIHTVWEELARVAQQRNASAAQLNVLISENSKEIFSTVTLRSAASAETTRANLRAGILAIFLCIGVGILAAALLTRMITKPLQRGVAFAQALSSGNFDARWAADSRDELGVLAAALNEAFAKVAEKTFFFESILNAVPYGISVTDLDMRWTYANAAALKAINKSSMKEIEGLHCSEKKGDICGTPDCGIEQLRKGNPHVKFTNAAGKSFSIDLTYLTNIAGKRAGHIEISRDITVEENLRREAAEAIARGRLEIVTTLESIVEGVSCASTELASQVEESERGAAITSERLTETATAMEEMNATVLEVARSAGNAAQVSHDAKAKAEEGAHIVEDVVLCINSVEQQSLQLKTDMVQLGEQAEAIGAIMNVISDIADQTNLLALNAAIEAARAGEAGRGFAVVADEVRKLAEKTMQATVEVGNAIKGVQHSADKNMKSVDASSQIVARATELVRQAGASLKEIVSLVDTSADQVRTIATAAEEQSSTSEEINRSLGTVSSAASESTRAMVEAAHAVADLSQQAQSLARLIGEMKRG